MKFVFNDGDVISVMDRVKIKLPARSLKSYQRLGSIESVNDDEIGSILEEIWSYEDEYLELVWCGQKIEIDLRYEFPYFFEEFLALCEWVFERKNGIENFDLCVDSFNLSMEAEIKTDTIKLGTNWDCYNKRSENIVNKNVNLDVLDFSETIRNTLFFVQNELFSSGKYYERLDIILLK